MADNKRIFKNTMYLYTRMLLIMGVSLYTSRVILNALGAEDYGIMNVVGGVITMFSFISGTISSAASRFFAFELGRNDHQRLNQYFCISVYSFLLVGMIVVLLAETVGLWFVKHELIIPPSRASAALWIYHASILVFILGIISTPYNSLVIAHEKMSVYAIVSVIEAALKLIIAFVITIDVFDRLKLYAFLLVVVTFITQLFYVFYCKVKFEKECRLITYWDKEKFAEFFSYSGWVLIGMLSGVCRGQGLNILLNMFFNPIINAARAIAYQIYSAIRQFMQNFYTAFRPQITKLYAQGENEEMLSLVYRSSRICYFLEFVFAMPIIACAANILKLWLGSYPTETVIFTKLVLVTGLIDSLSYPFIAAINATGKVKYFHIFTSGILLLTLPIAYIFLKLGFSASSALIISSLVSAASHVASMIIMRVQTGMSIMMYMKEVIVPIFIVTCISFFLCMAIKESLNLNTFFNLSVSLLFTTLIIFLFGLKSYERKLLISIIKKYILKAQ